jgi:hypothetical protein
MAFRMSAYLSVLHENDMVAQWELLACGCVS